MGASCFWPALRRLHKAESPVTALHACTYSCVYDSGLPITVCSYEDLLDWDEFSIRVPEHRMMDIPKILNDLSAEKIRRMHERVVFVYEHFLASLQIQVHAGAYKFMIDLVP